MTIRAFVAYRTSSPDGVTLERVPRRLALWTNTLEFFLEPFGYRYGWRFLANAMRREEENVITRVCIPATREQIEAFAEVFKFRNFEYREFENETD